MEKAVSKAERNAKRKLIPEKLAVETINKFIKQGNTMTLPPANNYQNRIEPPAKFAQVDYLSKLVTMLAKESCIKIDGGNITKGQVEIMIEIYNSYTGQTIKSLKVAQSTAQKYLMDFINSPTIINKK